MPSLPVSMNPMSVPPIPSPIKRYRWRTWQVLCLAGILIVAGFYTYRAIREARAEARLRELVAAIEKDDPQWKLADMESRYDKLPVSPAFPKCIKSIPPGYRGWAGDDIEVREDRLDYKGYGRDYNVLFPEKYYRILKERLSDEKVQAMRQALRELAKEPAGYRLPDGVGKNALDHIQNARQMGNKILDESILACHEADADHLLMALQMAISNARLLEQSSGMLHLLGAASLRDLGIAQMSRGLALCQLTDQQLQQMQMILSREQAPTVVQLLKCWRANFFDEWERAQVDPQKRSEFIFLYTNPPGTNPTWKERAEYWVHRVAVEFVLANLTTSKADLLEIASQALAVNANYPNQVSSFIEQRRKSTSDKLLSNSLQFCGTLIRTYHTHQALLDSLRAAIACERYRLAQGQWPAALDVLVPQYLPAIPLDPFTGKPLSYRLLADGVVVYSVGPDGLDDQGDVLDFNGGLKDKGTRLFNPELRGRKYEPPK